MHLIRLIRRISVIIPIQRNADITGMEFIDNGNKVIGVGCQYIRTCQGITAAAGQELICLQGLCFNSNLCDLVFFSLVSVSLTFPL